MQSKIQHPSFDLLRFAYVAQPGRVSAERSTDSIVAQRSIIAIFTNRKHTPKIPKSKVANGWVCGWMLSLRMLVSPQERYIS